MFSDVIFFVCNRQSVEEFDIIHNSTDKVLFFITVFFNGLNNNVDIFFLNAYVDDRGYVERGKRGFNCDKQVERAVTVLNHVLKGL